MKETINYILIFMWIYIIYYNLYMKKSIELYTLLNNNNKYVMIDLLNINDPILLSELINELNNINYFSNNNYIGLHNYYYNLKDFLIIIPYDKIKYITDNKMICMHIINNNIYPFEVKIQNNIIKKKIIKNYKINLDKNKLDNIYLKNIYNYKINKLNVPIYLLSKNDGLEVKLYKQLY